MARFIPYQGGRTLFVGVQGAARRVKGLDKITAKLARLPDQVVEEVRGALSDACDGLVEEMKAIAPTSELEPHPGALRESIHKEDGRHALSFDVICDAKDEQGRYYGAHVEFGHRGNKQDGFKLVPPKPFFFVAYRHQAKRIRSAVSRASTRAARAFAATDSGA